MWNNRKNESWNKHWLYLFLTWFYLSSIFLFFNENDSKRRLAAMDIKLSGRFFNEAIHCKSLKYLSLCANNKFPAFLAFHVLFYWRWVPKRTTKKLSASIRGPETRSFWSVKIIQIVNMCESTSVIFAYRYSLDKLQLIRKIYNWRCLFYFEIYLLRCL